MPAPRSPESGLDLAGRRRVSKLVESVTGQKEQPERLGRFEVERLLGEGAFGEVYLAIDPDLRRPLALKLLKQSANADALVRLRKEAQAMAALEHAELMTVYEIGTIGARAFIAMELAEGGTLDAWVRAEHRSFQEIAGQVEVAARGLAAAHKAGFVHRDVKPSNILVGSDGRAKVADFGLVHVQPHGDATDDEGLKTTLAGTPAYMAPEQFDGAEPTAKADQYALGVTLFEIVYGRRPTKRAPAIEDIGVPSHREQAPHRVPGWLREALYRALRFDPAQRFASMDDFADALASGMGQRRRRVRVVAGVTALVTAVGAGWFIRPDTEAVVPCAEQARGALVQTWSPARAETMSAGLRNTNTSYADALADATSARIDARATAWVEAWTASCGAEPTPAHVEEAACLDRQRTSLGALLEAPVGAASLDTMAAALGDALDPQACAQTQTRPSTTAAATPDGALGAQLREAEVTLARGAFSEARRTAELVLRQAQEAGQTRLVVDSAMLAARASLEQDDPAQAEVPAKDALNAALSVGLDVQASDAAVLLARAVAQRTEPEEALRWAELAVSLSTRSGRSIRARAEALTVLARTLALARNIPEAAVRCDEAIALAESSPDGPTAQSRLDCGRTWVSAGRFDDAKPQLERAIEGLKVRFGPAHPEVAASLQVLAGVFDQASRPKEALAAANEALELVRSAYGNEDHRILTALNTASGMSNRAADYDRSLALALEAADVARKTLSPGDRKYNNAVCMAAGFSMGFDCGDETRALADDCAGGIRKAEGKTPIADFSSPVASANAQGWVFAVLVYQCLEDAEAEAAARAALTRYVAADNVSFELQTMALAILANTDLAAEDYRGAEAKIRDLLERTRDTQVIKLREGMWRTTLTQALAKQGRRSEARDEAARALELMRDGDDESIGPERDWLTEFLAEDQ